MTHPELQFPFPTSRPQEKVTINFKGTNEMSLAEKCKYDGIQLMYVFNRDNPVTGGFSLAFRPSRVYKSTTMVDVAVSYCKPGERFNKKIGRDFALRRFLNGEYIQVPALRYGEDYMHEDLRGMFYNFIES